MSLYHRFNLSHRDIEDLLAEMRVNVNNESMRLWCIKFGPRYARTRRGKSSLISWKVMGATRVRDCKITWRWFWSKRLISSKQVLYFWAEGITLQSVTLTTGWSKNLSFQDTNKYTIKFIGCYWPTIDATVRFWYKADIGEHHFSPYPSRKILSVFIQ